MAGDVEHTRLSVVLVAAFEVVFRVDCHVGSGHLDVPVVGDVHPGAVVHLVVRSCGDGETRDGTFAVVEDGVYVGREDALVLVVHLHGGIGPPEEGLGQGSAVREASVDLEVRASRAQRKAHEPFLVEHTFHLVAPYGHAAVLAFFNPMVYGHVGRRAVVLRPIELDAPADPRPCEAH